MIDDALRYLSDQSVSASNPKTVFESTSSKHVLLPDGVVQEYRKELPWRNHDVESLHDLVAMANRFNEDDLTSPVVWYNECDVTLVINDNQYRNDIAVIDLNKSGLFKAINALDPRTWYPPKEFIRLLKVDLYGALEPQVLLNNVRKVQFDSGSTVRVENKRAVESMGKEISASVSAASELPEYVTLSAPLYLNPGLEFLALIRAAVEVDPNRQAFQLVVLPDEINSAISGAMRAIADMLSANLASGIPFYHGSPTR